MRFSLGGVRQLEVDHEGQLVDVGPRACHVEMATSTRSLPARQASRRVGALLLALVAVDGVGRDAAALEVVRQAAAHELGVDEWPGLVSGLWRSRWASRLRFMPGTPVVFTWVMVSDTMLRRATSISCGSFQRIWSAGAISSGWVAENSELWRCLGRGEDALDVGDEAHVEHAVGFVQHQHSTCDRLIDFCSGKWSSNRPRRGDDDLDAAAQLGLLRADVDAAIDAHQSAAPQIVLLPRS